MSNWIRKFQKRKNNKPRKGRGTRSQRKGPTQIRPVQPPKEKKADD